VSRQALALCWIWIVAILVFFSIPRSKLIGYILPVTPPLALLAAVGWSRLMDGRRAAGIWLTGLAALMPVVVCVASIVAVRHIPSLTRSSQGIAQVLACDAGANDPVYAVGSFPYDLPFYARMTHPLIVVQDWARLRTTEGDTWKRELFEAGDFAPALADRLLQSPPAALAAARSTLNAWVVVTHGAAFDSEGFRQVAQAGRWTLYTSPARPLRTCLKP
jgi:hypothetical protein